MAFSSRSGGDPPTPAYTIHLAHLSPPPPGGSRRPHARIATSDGAPSSPRLPLPLSSEERNLVVGGEGGGARGVVLLPGIPPLLPSSGSRVGPSPPPAPASSSRRAELGSFFFLPSSFRAHHPPPPPPPPPPPLLGGRHPSYSPSRCWRTTRAARSWRARGGGGGGDMHSMGGRDSLFLAERETAKNPPCPVGGGWRGASPPKISPVCVFCLSLGIS
jgi:hypothetical protein